MTRRAWLAAGALWLVAAVYFQISTPLTLEWVDEGMIVYQSWRVAEGAIPYREFQHFYAPATFFLNAAVLRLAGFDLAVIRTVLVLVKATTVALAFLATLRVASIGIAAGASVIAVAILGLPVWVSNTPYAGHYALPLCIGGVLAFDLWRRRPWLAAAVAGVVFGIAATFKQTSGLFALLGLGLALLGEPAEAGRVRSEWPRSVPAVICAAWLVAALGVAFSYVSSAGGTAGTAVLLLVPWILLVAIAARQWRGGGPAMGMSGAAGALVVASLGFAVPLALCVGFYASLGLLDRLIFSTVSGLPHMARWFVPVSGAAPRPTVALVALIAALSIPLLGPVNDTSRPWARRVRNGAAIAFLLAAAVAIAASIRAPGAAVGDTLQVVRLAPLPIVWGATALLLLDALRPGGSAGTAAASRRTAPSASLFVALAAASLLTLSPAADVWHVVLIIPALVPALAALMARVRVDPGSSAVRLVTAVRVAVVIVVCAPLVQLLASTWMRRVPIVPPFARARSLAVPDAGTAEAARLVEFLAGQPADRPLFLASGEQMLAFLAGRRSAMESSDVVRYMAVFGTIDAADAQAAAPEAETIAALAAVRPLLVVRTDTTRLDHFRAAYPVVARYLDEHTRPIQHFGPFQVRDWQG